MRTFESNQWDWTGQWSLCYNFFCMFMSLLLQLANSALERKTRCDMASILVTNTQKLSVRDCIPRSVRTRKENARFEDSEFSTHNLKTADTLFPLE